MFNGQALHRSGHQGRERRHYAGEVGLHADYQVIALSPWSCQEMFELTLRAFNFSERYRVPVMVMADEAVGHLRETVTLPAKVEVWNRKKQKGGAPFGTEEEDGIPLCLPLERESGSP